MRLAVAAPLLGAVLGAPIAFAQDKPGRGETAARETAAAPEGVDSYVERLMASLEVVVVQELHGLCGAASAHLPQRNPKICLENHSNADKTQSRHLHFERKSSRLPG